MALSYGAEIGGALEHAELVIVVLAVDRVTQPESRIMEIDIALGLRHQRPEGKEIGNVIELCLLAVVNDEDVDRRGVIETGMEQDEGEALRLSAPYRLFRIETDVAILIIGEIVEAGRHGDFFFDKGLLGASPRQ